MNRALGQTAGNRAAAGVAASTTERRRFRLGAERRTFQRRVAADGRAGSDVEVEICMFVARRAFDLDWVRVCQTVIRVLVCCNLQCLMYMDMYNT